MLAFSSFLRISDPQDSKVKSKFLLLCLKELWDFEAYWKSIRSTAKVYWSIFKAIPKV